MITTNPIEFQKQISLHNHSFQPKSASRPEHQPKVRWPGLMNLSTLAEYLDMSASTVSNMIKDGQLPPPTVSPTPRLKRWSRECIDAYFEKKLEAKMKGPSIDDVMARSFVKNRGSC